MIPHSNSGRGFVGLVRYLMHDKEANSNERVHLVHTENIAGNTARAALSEMLWTFQRQRELKIQAGVKLTGRKLEKPVYHLSLSWHPTERPDDGQMIQAARDALAVQGLQDHQILMVIHNDTEHRHIHAMVNRVHPQTGVAATLKLDHQKFSRWAERYEKERGKVWCQERVRNNLERDFRKQAAGKAKFVKDARSQRSDSAAGFSARATNFAGMGRVDAKRAAQAAAAARHTAIERHRALMIAEQQRQREARRAEVSANREQADLQNRRLDEDRTGEAARQQKREALEARLSQFYDPDLDRMRRELAEISARQQLTGMDRLFYRKSEEERDLERADALRKSIDSAENRKAEARAALENEAAQEGREEQGDQPAAKGYRRAANDTPAERRRLSDRLNRREVWKAVIDARQKGEARFEEWAANKRADLHTARLEAQERQAAAHRDERAALETRLVVLYGDDALAGKRKELVGIQERRQQKGMRGMLYRLIGAAADNDRAEAIEKTISSAEFRMDEARENLQRTQERETRELATNHDIFGRSLDAEISKARGEGISRGYGTLELNRSFDNDSGGLGRHIER